MHFLNCRQRRTIMIGYLQTRGPAKTRHEKNEQGETDFINQRHSEFGSLPGLCPAISCLESFRDLGKILPYELLSGWQARLLLQEGSRGPTCEFAGLGDCSVVFSLLLFSPEVLRMYFHTSPAG
jgi:hypothetical protein